MSLAFKHVRVYSRLLLIVAAAGAIGLVLFKNRHHDVNVWFFGITDATEPINVVWLMLFTAAAALVSWWIFSLGRGMLRDMRGLRAAERVRSEARQLDQRKQELDDRERRIDEKVSRSIGGENAGKKIQ